MAERTKASFWEGKVAVHKFMFATQHRAKITDQEIIIYKRDINKPKVLIRKSDIVAISTPKMSLTETLVTGYKGFSVYYKENGQEKVLNFWPNVFSGYQDNNQLPAFSEALSKLSNKGVNEIKDFSSYKDNSYIMYILITVASLVGLLLSGFLGALIMATCGIFSVKIYQSSKIDKLVKFISIGAIYFGGIIAIFILQFVLLVLMQEVS